MTLEEAGVAKLQQLPENERQKLLVLIDAWIEQHRTTDPTVGGETLQRSWGVLKSGGTLATIAAQSEGTRDSAVRDAFFMVAANRSQLAEIAGLIDNGQIRRVVAGCPPAVDPALVADLWSAHQPHRARLWQYA